jgi:hypothetical protein
MGIGGLLAAPHSDGFAVCPSPLRGREEELPYLRAFSSIRGSKSRSGQLTRQGVAVGLAGVRVFGRDLVEAGAVKHDGAIAE